MKPVRMNFRCNCGIDGIKVLLPKISSSVQVDNRDIQCSNITTGSFVTLPM